MPFNINHIGHLPFNPDNLLNKGRFFNRPAGFSYADIIKMYWTVRSFKVNITILNTNQEDPLSSFILGGGTIGGIGGALGGLAAAQSAITRNPGSLTMTGYTKISHKYDISIRKKRTSSVPFEGAKRDKTNNNILDQINTEKGDFEIETDTTIVKDNFLFTENLTPNEGTICSAGPIHSIIKPGGYLKIDLSDIIYFQEKYWPLITFLAAAGDTTYSSNPANSNAEVRGGIFIMDALVPLYADMTFSPTRIRGMIVANGKVVPGDRCCDRFLWDGKDDVRLEKGDDKCKKNCSDDPLTGVYKKKKEEFKKS